MLDTLSPQGAGDRNMLAARAKRAGFQIADHDGWSDIFSKVLAARVEPNLGLDHPTILYEYPRAEAALARPNPTIRGSPNGSSFMPVAWSWPTALAS